MSDGEIILYNTEDGEAEIQLRATDGTVWLTQARMAGLFATSPQAITQLIRSIYEGAELTEEATCNEFLQVRSEGGRQVRRSLRHYSLEMILAVGYRFRSPRGQVGAGAHHLPQLERAAEVAGGPAQSRPSKPSASRTTAMPSSTPSERRPSSSLQPRWTISRN